MNGKAAASPEQIAALVADQLAGPVAERLAEQIDYEALADRTATKVVERWSTPGGTELVSAKWLAARHGRSPRWWREHKEEFGGIPRGTGPKPRIDFDPVYVATVLARWQV